MSALHRVRIFGAAENDYGQRREVRTLAQPFQDVEAVRAGHLQIKKEQVGKRGGGAIMKWWRALQIINCLGTIWNEMEPGLEPRSLESPTQQERILRIILGHKNQRSRVAFVNNQFFQGWRCYNPDSGFQT